MTEGTESSSARRRRRRRATASQGAPAPRETAPEAPAVAPAVDAAPKRPAKKSRTQRDATERGLRDLVGAGKSQLGVDGALRGRDVNRPTEQDLAEAEQNLVLVRRNWKPPPDAPKP